MVDKIVTNEISTTMIKLEIIYTKQHSLHFWTNSIEHKVHNQVISWIIEIMY